MLRNSGTFRQYMITAILNSAFFYAVWELCYWFLPNDAYWPSISWAIAWIIGSYFAHWTHREWTFDSNRDTSWTVPASMSVYTVGWVGSTACYYIGSVSLELNVRVVWLLNSALWGVLNYIGQREIAFKSINISPLLSDE